MRVDIPLGTRRPATTGTAVGRVLLSHAHGGSDDDLVYALADEEWEQGVRTLAVPVHDRAGRTIAALATSTHTARRTAEDCVDTLLPALTTTATHIEAALHTASRFTPVPVT